MKNKISVRYFVRLTSGELAPIGAQTLMNVIDGIRPCKLAVGGEIHYIELVCSREGRKLTGVLMTSASKYKMLSNGYLDRACFMSHVVQLLHAGEDADKISAECKWSPTNEQLQACRKMLNLPG